MGVVNPRHLARERRKLRVRKKVAGSQVRPRLCVFKSNKHMYAQVIDDGVGATLAAASTLSPEIKAEAGELNKTDAARRVGKLLAQRCLDKDIKHVVFDRNGFLYKGRVSAVADGARETGLVF